MADSYDVVVQPDDFVLVDNSDDWTIYTPVDAEYTVEFQSVGLNDAAITVAARDAAIAAQHATEAVQTATGAMLATFSGGLTGQIIIKASNADYDFGWANPTGMLTAIYDPNNHMADAFNRANHTGTQLAATISNFNAAADARVTAAIGVSVQGYTAILAGTTASYTVALDTKLAGIAAGADVTVGALAPAIHGAVSKATPVDADELALSDSAAAFGLKKLTWAQVKATLKTYFDTLHGALAAANTWAARNVFVGGGTGNSAMATATASLGEIETRGNGTGAAMAAFHRPGSFAAYFGIDTDNVWKVGGWSMGAVAYKVWHEGSDGAGSGLDADLLDGLNSASAATVSTIAARDASGDITTRLFRTEYAGGGGTGAYFLTQNAIGSGADNYARPMDLATAKTTLGIGSMANRSVTISAAAPSGGVDGDVWFQI